jgi:hypothetical protein
MSAAPIPPTTPVEGALQQQQTHVPLRGLPVLGSVLDYKKLHRIGEGTYGVVHNRLFDVLCSSAPPCNLH